MTVGSFEAKTHFAALLDRVLGGEEITITRRGTPVAMLVPVRTAGNRQARSVVERIRAFRKGKTLGGLSIRQLIEEGRRY